MGTNVSSASSDDSASTPSVDTYVSTLLRLPPRTVDLLNTASEIENADPTTQDLAFLARVFCQAALPYKNPGVNVPDWIRVNGPLTLRVVPEGVPTFLPGGGMGPSTYNHAYGLVPRLLLVWLSTVVTRGTDAVDHATRTVELGDSLTAFLGNIGVEGVTGGVKGSLTRVRRQVSALAASTIQIRVEKRADWNPDYQTLSIINTTFADRTFLAWSSRDPIGAEALVKPTITLSEQMYDLMRNHSVPLDGRALEVLTKYEIGRAHV